MARLLPTEYEPRLGEKWNPGEAMAFAAFRDGLSDDYTVIHSVRHGDDWEADFLVLHPTKGGVVVEVKGGKVEYREDTSRWYQWSSQRDLWHEIDPFKQARSAARGLGDGTKEANPPIFWAYIASAVMFTGTGGRAADFSGEFKDFVITQDHLSPDALQQRVDRLLKLSSERGPVREGEFERFVNYWRRDAKPEPSVGFKLKLADQAVITADDEQSAIAAVLGTLQRLVVHGPAGSGKTVVAIIEAQLASAASTKCLFLVPHEGLRDQVTGALGADQEALVQVQTFDEFIAWLPNDVDSDGFSVDQYRMDRILSNFAAVQDFELVLIDEAQLLSPETFEALIDVFRNARVHLFLDDNQRIFDIDRMRGSLELGDTWHWAPLRKVYRNSQQVYSEVLHYYTDDQNGEIEFRGFDGLPVRRFETKTQDLSFVIGERLAHLVDTNGIGLPSIVLLVASVSVLGLLDNSLAGRFTLSRIPNSRETVKLALVSEFVGLDTPVAIVVRDGETKESAETSYTSLSRARALLEIIDYYD